MSSNNTAKDVLVVIQESLSLDDRSEMSDVDNDSTINKETCPSDIGENKGLDLDMNNLPLTELRKVSEHDISIPGETTTCEHSGSVLSGTADGTSQSSDSVEQWLYVKPPLIYRQLRKVSEHDISVPDGKTTCHHSGSVLLRNGCMVYIDCTNLILKLISPEFEVLDYRVLESKPQDIALLINDEIAVAFHKSIHIFRISTDYVLIYDREFCTRDIISGIASIGTDLAILYVYDNHNSCDYYDDEYEYDDDPEVNIQIRTNRNLILTNINEFNDRFGHSVRFRNPRGIRTRNNHEIFLWKRDVLMCLKPAMDLSQHPTSNLG